MTMDANTSQAIRDLCMLVFLCWSVWIFTRKS